MKLSSKLQLKYYTVVVSLNAWIIPYSKCSKEFIESCNTWLYKLDSGSCSGKVLIYPFYGKDFTCGFDTQNYPKLQDLLGTQPDTHIIQRQTQPNPYPLIFSGNTLVYPWVPTLNFYPWVSWVPALIFYPWIPWVPVLSF